MIFYGTIIILLQKCEMCSIKIVDYSLHNTLRNRVAIQSILIVHSVQYENAQWSSRHAQCIISLFMSIKIETCHTSLTLCRHDVIPFSYIATVLDRDSVCVDVCVMNRYLVFTFCE
jgi:hypothetical protein